MSAESSSGNPTGSSTKGNQGDLLQSLLSGDREGIGGALCNDPTGLCLGVNGEMDASKSGVYTSLVRLASELEQSGNEAALITIETDAAAILVKEYDGHTVALRVPVKDSEAETPTSGTFESDNDEVMSQTA